MHGQQDIKFRNVWCWKIWCVLGVHYEWVFFCLALRENGTPGVFFLREGLQFTTQLFEMKHRFAEYQTRHTIPNWNQDAVPGVGVRVHYNHAAAAACLEQMKLSTANTIGT